MKKVLFALSALFVLNSCGESKKKEEGGFQMNRTKKETTLKKEKQESPSNSKVDLSDFEDEILKITYKDYYFSNVIARSSKTMLNCNNSKLEVKRTGTEG